MEEMDLRKRFQIIPNELDTKSGSEKKKKKKRVGYEVHLKNKSKELGIRNPLQTDFIKTTSIDVKYSPKSSHPNET